MDYSCRLHLGLNESKRRLTSTGKSCTMIEQICMLYDALCKRSLELRGNRSRLQMPWSNWCFKLFVLKSVQRPGRDRSGHTTVLRTLFQLCL